VTALTRLLLEGSHEAMGAAHGESLRSQIRELADEGLEIIRSSNDITSAEVRRTAEEVEREIERQVPRVYAETVSTARAAGIDYWRLIVAGGYSDIEDRAAPNNDGSREARSNCTLIPWRVAGGQLLLAGTWDSHATAEPSLVLIERRPAEGPLSLALSTAGWPMQQGVTSEGLGFAIANLVAKRTRPGLSYIAALPAITARTDLEQATRYERSLVICSARFYAFADESGGYIGIETDGEARWTSDLPDVHTNHFVYGDATTAEGRDTTASERRLQRARLEVRAAMPVDATSLFRVLEINDGTEESISRRAQGRETRSCAGFVLDPVERSILATAGPPGLSTPQRYTLDSA
jgi:Acyl-coenzyme A:6-aminopenicillanic acid acyl-transferase